MELIDRQQLLESEIHNVMSKDPNRKYKKYYTSSNLLEITIV